MVDEFDNVAIIKRLKEACEANSDKELSKLLGATPSKVSSWKTIKSPPYAACFWVAQEYGVSMQWLLLGKGDKQENTLTDPLQIVEKARFTEVFVQVIRHAEQIQALDVAKDVHDSELKRFGLTLYNLLYQEETDTLFPLADKRRNIDRK